MNIGETLQRDPAKNPLVNQGQARISEESSQRVLDELKGELSTFVCEGQYADGIHRIISSYLGSVNKTSQKGAWVSGFFGSGKSHLLKMLCHLWQNTEFSDGSTARSIVPAMPADLNALFIELETAGRREGGLFAAAGSMPSGSTEHVRLTILSIILRAVGLPSSCVAAKFTLWLQEQGYLEKVRAKVSAAGKSFDAEVLNLYVSNVIAKALIDCDPHFAPSEKEAKQTLKAQFPPQSGDVTSEEFLRILKQALAFRSGGGKLPCTLLILDEVQQYIGDSHERATTVTEVAEAVCKQLDSKVMIVSAGQSALTAMPQLQKMMDRFTIRVALSDTDVETVTRKVLLQKKPSAIKTIKGVLDANAGEVSRQLSGTSIGENGSDREIIVEDYPLLPVRRRFWEHCFRVVDAAGTQSQLRSQLRILHDAIARLSGSELGAVVPADELYEALAAEMVNTGALPREINERIIDLSRDGTDEGRLARRICGLVFLIGKLPRETGADIGVRSTKEHIADLLVDDLSGDNGKLRSRVGKRIDELVEDGTLMRLSDDEVRLQTREGAEWDREFRNRQAKLRNNLGDLQIKRDQLLYAEVDRSVRQLSIKQGASKVPRPILVGRDQTPPLTVGDQIPMWVRDGWSMSEKDLKDAARAAGSENPLIAVFIPKKSGDDLDRLLVEADAATQTLDIKGSVAPGSAGAEARLSMEARRNQAVLHRDKLVNDIVSNAKVFQGGGNELLHMTLDAKLREAAEASLARMFPRFKDADFSASAWEAAIKRIREGADQPFQPVGYTGPIEQHPVCQQVLLSIGSGASGTELRKSLRGTPFGWPQDAIDAAVLALHRFEHIGAKLNGVVVPLGKLDQNKIAKAEFLVEKATISVPQKLTVRKMFSAVGVGSKSGEESIKAPEFVSALERLIASAGGDPPAPHVPAYPLLDEMRNLAGTQQLLAIAGAAADLEGKIADWKNRADLIGKRLPAWNLLDRLATHADGVEEATAILEEIDAIRSGRLLLEAANPVAPQLKALSALLRTRLTGLGQSQQRAFDAGMATLDATEVCTKLTGPQRDGILTTLQLTAPAMPDTSSSEAILSALDQRSLSARQADLDAVGFRVQKAIEQAAQLLVPKVRRVAVISATLHTEKDVDTWLQGQRKKLLEALEDGPILIS
jgi:hypothetical protein